MMTDSEIVLAVIRGELPVAELTKAGVMLAVVPEASIPARHEIIADQVRPFEVSPTITEIAQGLLARAGDLNESHKWASLLIGAGWVRLEGLDEDSDWDVILGGIWDAIFGEAVSQTIIDTATRIVNRGCKFSEYELVKLKRPQSGLAAGAIGVIVMVYDSVPPGYEVEFTDADGATLALLTLRDDDLEPATPTE